jgi:hypothetical protein
MQLEAPDNSNGFVTTFTLVWGKSDFWNMKGIYLTPISRMRYVNHVTSSEFYLESINSSYCILCHLTS